MLSITVNVRMTNKDYYYYYTIILKSKREWTAADSTLVCCWQAGDTSLHAAVREGLLTSVQNLCHLGCETDLPNKQGLYPLHLAARYGHSDIARSVTIIFVVIIVKTYD